MNRLAFQAISDIIYFCTYSTAMIITSEHLYDIIFNAHITYYFNSWKLGTKDLLIVDKQDI